MKLRFNEGAIVNFDLVDGTSISGKVIKVYEDELEILEQLRIECGFFEYYPDRTRDGEEIIHLNRQLIKSWKYEKPSGFSGGDGNYSNAIVNIYASDGTFKGEGKWCGDIEEHYASALIVPNPQKDDYALSNELF